MFKRFLASIIFLSMAVTVMLGAFLVSAEGESEGVTIRYNIGDIVTQLGSGALFEDYNYELTNGLWSFFSAVDGATTFNDYLKYRPGNIQTGGGRWIAFEVFVPKAGTYTMQMYHGEYNTGTDVSVYMSSGKASTLADDLLGKYNIDNDSVSDFTVVSEPKKIENIVISSPGKYVFTFQSGSYGSVGTFELVSGTGTCLASAGWDIDKTELNLEGNKTAQISHKFYASDGTEITDGSYDEDIVYDSSNKSVATVDENGLVTAVGAGKTTITASVTNEGGYTFEFEKEISVEEHGITLYYDIHKHYVVANSEKFENIYSTATTNGFYSYYTNNGNLETGTTNTGKIKYNSHLQVKTGSSISFKINIPEAGYYDFYEVVKGQTNTSWNGDVQVYIEKEYNCASSDMLKNTYNCYSDGAGAKKLGSVYVDEAGERIVTFKVTGTNWAWICDFYLTNGTGSAIVNGSAEENLSFTMGDEAQNVNASGYLSATATAAENITYKSSNENVATVDESGNVTPVGPGNAVITTIFDDAVVNSELTTAVKVVAPTAEITEDDKLSFGIYQINGADTDITVEMPENIAVGSSQQAKVGSTVKATVKDEVEGKSFAYWRVGGSYYTSEKTIEYTLNTNASIVAVYTDAPTEDTKIVEFWNENGQYLDIKTVENGAVTMPSNPSLTGYIFDKWYVNETDEFVNSDITAALTRVVAKYTRGDNDTGKSITGSIKVYADGSDTATQTITEPAYNTAVTVSATAQEGKVFSHWTRDGEIVSYDSEYTFRAWGATEIKAVFADAAPEKAPVIAIAKTKIGNASMIEYEVPQGYTKIEAGIVFNSIGSAKETTVISFGSKATAKNEGARGQFTATGESDDIVARGYLIYKDNSNSKTYIIYAD